MKILHIRVLAVIGAALVLMIGGAVAYAQIPAADGTISSCYMKSTGTIRIIDTGVACKKGETSLTWNQKGQPGTNGTNGTPGTNGTNGVSGYEIVSKDDNFTGSGTIGGTLVKCPAGKKVVGGGGAFIGSNGPGSNSSTANTNTITSFPLEDGTGWSAAFETNGDLSIIGITGFRTYAICVTATP